MTLGDAPPGAPERANRRRDAWVASTAALVLALWPAFTLADARVEARRHFKAGMALIGEGKFDEGIAELMEAYAIKPHPNVLFNIAKAHESAGRPAEALSFYGQYLAADPPDASTVRQTVARLGQQLAEKEAPPVRPPAAAPVPAPAPPPVDDAATARLAALAERLERALARVEGAGQTSADSAGESTRAPVETPEDFALPYEETVMAASRRAESTREAPNATTILSAEEIALSGATNLPDLLRRVPGAEVMTMGYASANVSFRGFNQRISNKVLVLVDGRPEYQDYLGVTMWPIIAIGLEEIERIEVIRGPAGALYGANAMMGVVNIITRAPGAGPRAQLSGLAGNGNVAGGSLVASGGDRVKFRASAGYSQGDKYTVDYPPDRADVLSLSPDPNVGVRGARGSLTVHTTLARGVSISASGGIHRLFSEVYGLGLLRNYLFDGIGGFVKTDVSMGPAKVRFFWNHTAALAKPQYEPIGQRSLGSAMEGNVFDGELLLQHGFSLLGTHQVAAGASARLKRLSWNYTGPLREELHAAAFVQDEYRPIPQVSLVGSFRIDRHPLLDNGLPGYTPSPRLSAVVAPFEGQAFRASFATAFRQPAFIESYTEVRVPVPGVNGASVLTQGNVSLRPERMISLELGYRGEVAKAGLSWELATYWNIVSDLVVLSAVAPVAPEGAWDVPSGSFLLGRSQFQNDPAVYTARGAELGVTWNAARGLDLRAAAAVQQVLPNQSVEGVPCGPCLQAPAAKFNLGFTWRTPVRLDVSADASYASPTTWVEREPSASDPTRILTPQNFLGGYTVLNARVAYRFLDDRVSVGVVGSQLAATHQEHPFGNNINRRIFAQLTVAP